MKNKIYNDFREWYHPEIDYQEMIEKFKWTRNQLSDLMHYPYPLDHIDMFTHAKMWDIDEKTKKEVPSKQQVFQFWNKQFNDNLEKILRDIKAKLILDAGAGDGLLSKVLTERGFKVIAIDNYKWPFEKRYFKVKKMDYKEALKKFKPDVVICSWMPLNTNWTPTFRATKSIKHYITIGEVNAACGGDWEERKGWIMRYDKKSSKYALCRTDSLWFRGQKSPYQDFSMHHSSVYLFSRKEKNERRSV